MIKRFKMARADKDKFLSGFTLLELLVAIAIVGVLSSIVIFSQREMRERAHATAVLQQLQEIEKAFDVYVLAEQPFSQWPVTNYTPSWYLENLIDQNDGRYDDLFAGFDKYLRQAPVPPRGGHYGLDYRYGSYTCVGANAPYTGVNIRIETADAAYMARLFTQIDKIIDQSDGPACGKMRTSLPGDGSGSLYYVIAGDATDL